MRIRIRRQFQRGSTEAEAGRTLPRTAVGTSTGCTVHDADSVEQEHQQRERVLPGATRAHHVTGLDAELPHVVRKELRVLLIVLVEVESHYGNGIAHHLPTSGSVICEPCDASLPYLHVGQLNAKYNDG
jgi:hypothetical protein